MLKIVCLGDSLTRGYKIPPEYAWPNILQNELSINVINRGISGDTTAGMLSRFYPDVVSNYPLYVIIMGGTNDIWWNVNQNIIQANTQAMVKQAEYYEIIPIIGSPLPANLEGDTWGLRSRVESSQKKLAQLTKSLQVQARTYNILFLDFYQLFLTEDTPKKEYYLDCIHPSKKGHKIIAEHAVDSLKHELFKNG